MTPTYDPTDVTLVSTLGPIRISPTSGLVTTETGGTAQFTVVLAQQPTDNVTIGLSSSNTSAGTVSPARLIFTPSNWNIAQTVTITGVADGVVTPDTAYIITAPAVSTDPAFNGLPGSDVAVINQETETCDLQVTGLRITPATGLEAGSSLVVNWNDSNTGDTAMSGSWVDSIAIQNLTTGKTLLSDTVPYDEQTKGRLGGGASFAQHYAFTLPAGADGTGQLQVTVTVDANNQVYERNSNGTAKQNNSATLTAQSIAVAPDLQVTNLAVSPSSPQSGDTLAISWDDKNTGNQATAVSWYDELVVQNTDTKQTLLDTTVYHDASYPGQSRRRGNPGNGLHLPSPRR